MEELVDALFSGPTQGGLTSPFPEGLSLQGWSLEDGLLTLSLSEQYGGLADVSLTLADYCLVLTLSQVDGVDAVQIQSARTHLPLPQPPDHAGGGGPSGSGGPDRLRKLSHLLFS